MQRARSLKDLIRQPFGAYHNLTVLISLHEKNTPALAICQARVFETGNSLDSSQFAVHITPDSDAKESFVGSVKQGYHDLVRHDVLELVSTGEHNVLDIGGGVGACAAYLKSCGKATRATVVDLVGDNCLPEIDAAYGGDLEDPELLARVSEEQGPFDVILCLDVLEHLKDPWSVVSLAHKILKPGGILVVSVPNVRNYRLVVPLVLRNQFQLTEKGLMDRTHLRWFVRDTAIDLVTGSGLKLEKVVDHFEGPKKELFNKLTFGLFSSFLTIQFYLSARKVD